jgi:hypothetical protein
MDSSSISRKEVIYVSDPEKKVFACGPYPVHELRAVTVNDFLWYIKRLQKLQSLLIVNRFIYKWIQRYRMKQWLLKWSVSPDGWDTQDILSKYTKFTRTKVRSIKRASSFPVLPDVDTYEDINRYRS